jgi:hypothetical protein
MEHTFCANHFIIKNQCLYRRKVLHIIQNNYNYEHLKKFQTHYSSIVLLGIEFDGTNGDVEGVDVFVK